MEHENIIENFIESLKDVLTKVVEKHSKMEVTNTLKNPVRYTGTKQVLYKNVQAQSSAITTYGKVSSDPGAVPPGIILEKNYTVKELANGNQEIKQEDPIETELK